MPPREGPELLCILNAVNIADNKKNVSQELSALVAVIDAIQCLTGDPLQE